VWVAGALRRRLETRAKAAGLTLAQLVRKELAEKVAT
jgi:hypothetical protein